MAVTYQIVYDPAPNRLGAFFGEDKPWKALIFKDRQLVDALSAFSLEGVVILLNAVIHAPVEVFRIETP